MTKIDVSVVLNMHREAPYIRATLRSLDACALMAREAGLRCELISVFDRADTSTRQIFKETPLQGFDSRKSVDVDVGSLGLARNAGVAAAHGEYIWTADGDDLVSRNAIVELHRAATAHATEDCVVFVNYLMAFGEQFHVGKYFPSSYLTVADFAYMHPYVSRIFLRRSVFEHCQYSDLQVASGYAYEDWDFNVRLRREGFHFLVAENTLFLYRQRSGSLLRQTDSVYNRIIPHTKLFDPSWFVRELYFEKQKVGDWAAFVDMRQRTLSANYARDIIDSPILRTELLEANKLDPEVDLTRIETSVSYSPIPWHADHWGFRLAEAFQLTGPGPYTDVVLLPWLNAGGAEKYILHILQELDHVDPKAHILVLCGEPAQQHLWADRLPVRSRLLDVYNTFPTLSDQDRDRMTVRLLLAVSAPHARLHIKSSVFSHRLIDAYGSILLDHFLAIYYRFSDVRFYWKGAHLAAPYTVKFLRRHQSALHWVICDCECIARQDRDRIGEVPDRYQVIRAPVSQQETPVKTALQPSRRLLWASRISEDKRPDLLPPLVNHLRSLWPDLVIEIHGHSDTGQDTRRLFDVRGLEYKGAYDGFESLPLENFDAIVYTSAYDGMPNVVLEALSAGLPVIAPDVGGIGEAVIDGRTGYLIPNEADDAILIGHYVRAIQQLYRDWASVPDMADAARVLIRQQYSPSAFVQQVSSVFSCDASTAGCPDSHCTPSEVNHP